MSVCLRCWLMTVFLAMGFGLQGQEQLAPLPNNDRLKLGKSTNLNNALRNTPLDLPFVDDFNQQSPYPDELKWEDNFVFINNTYPVGPQVWALPLSTD